MKKRTARCLSWRVSHEGPPAIHAHNDHTKRQRHGAYLLALAWLGHRSALECVAGVQGAARAVQELPPGGPRPSRELKATVLRGRRLQRHCHRHVLRAILDPAGTMVLVRRKGAHARELEIHLKMGSGGH